MARLTPRSDLPSITEGDDVDFPMTFTDADGNAIDITGWTVSITVADRNDLSNTHISKDISSHDDATAGKTSFSFAAADTSGVIGPKAYDIQITKADGTVRTIVAGRVVFEDGATDRSV